MRTSSRTRSARVGSSGGLALRAAAAAADRAEERFGRLAEEREQEQLLLAGGEAFGRLADLVQVDRRLEHRLVAAHEPDGAQDCVVDLRGRRPEPPGEQRAELVDHGLVAARREDVDQRLRGQDLSDRRGERRPAGLRADPHELVDDLVEPVAGSGRAQILVERRDEARRQAVLRGASGDPRRDRRDGLVADVLVDDVGHLPESVDVHAGVEVGRRERAGERLAGHPVQRQRERVDGGGDQVGARPRGLVRGCESAPPEPWQ